VEIQGPDLAGQPREDTCEQHGQQEDVVCERLERVETRRLDRVVAHAGQRCLVDLVTERVGHDVPVRAQVGDVGPGKGEPGESGGGKEGDEHRGQGVELDHSDRVLGHSGGKAARKISLKRSLPPAIMKVSGMVSRASESIFSVSRRMSHWA